MADTDLDWARGYAAQALSDLETRDKLAEAGAHKCHRLHFLQMAAEKACKAHLTMVNGHDSVWRSHAYAAKNLPIIARQFYAFLHDGNPIKKWEMEEIKRLAKEIEVLAPACDDGDVREDNTEYPWLDSVGDVRVPCEYKFPKIDDGNRSIIGLIRLIRTAAERYAI